MNVEPSVEAFLPTRKLVHAGDWMMQAASRRMVMMVFCMVLFYVLERKQFCLVIGKLYCSLPKKKGGWAAITASPYIAAKLVFTEEGVS